MELQPYRRHLGIAAIGSQLWRHRTPVRRLIQQGINHYRNNRARQAAVAEIRRQANPEYNRPARRSLDRDLERAMSKKVYKSKSVKRKRNVPAKRRTTVRRNRKRTYKSRRPIYKAKRQSTIKPPRPTATSIFRGHNPITYQNTEVSTWFCKPGAQEWNLNYGSPNLVDVRQFFLTAYNVTAQSNIPPNVKLAFQSSVSHKFRWLSATPGEAVHYICKARDDIAVLVSSNPPSYINQCIDATETVYVNGKQPETLENYGYTPYQSATFCERFKIVKVIKRKCQPGDEWTKTFKSKPIVISNELSTAKSALKGDIFVLTFIRGSLGICTGNTTTSGSTTTTSTYLSVGSTVTTTYGQCAVLSTYNYRFAPQDASAIAVAQQPNTKYVQLNIPSQATTNDVVSWQGLISTEINDQPTQVHG